MLECALADVCVRMCVRMYVCVCVRLCVGVCARRHVCVCMGVRLCATVVYGRQCAFMFTIISVHEWVLAGLSFCGVRALMLEAQMCSSL